MEVLRQVMNFASQSNPSRLTMYNHEEEVLLTAQVYAAIEEEVKRIAVEEAKMLAVEEAKRIASEEAELQRLAEQEALKVVVEMAARIAEVESKRLADEQALILNQDTIMTEQETPHQASDRGKTVVTDTSPPISPIRTLKERGTPYTTITPEIQAVLDGMQAQISELKDGMQAEIAEIKADSKVKGEQMDQILYFLKDLHERLPPKP
jgi:hypothetical protein